MPARTWMLVGVSALLAACAAEARHDYAPPAWVPPAVPSELVDRIDVVAGDSVQDAIARAKPGAWIVLGPGIHQGPLLVDQPVTIFGPRDAVVATNGQDSTVTVHSNDARLSGFTVRGSGRRFDLLDSAVRVRGADIVVEGLSIEEALFGILVERSERVCIQSNHVQGTNQSALGLRGDGIRIWETTDSEILNNHVENSRDVVVWYSSRNRVAGNVVAHSRYGTHFMYSHDNEVVGNRYLDNVVGVFLMYSRNVTLQRNLIARSKGSAGMGLGVKESGNLEVRENLFLQNTVGVYLDSSPLNLNHHNVFDRNVIRLGGTGVSFHGRTARNTFTGNSLRDNQIQVRVSGGGDALAADWHGNDFDDYQGYDLDDDGVGDIPFELRSLSSDLASTYPQLALFHGSLTLHLVDLAAHVMPLFKTRTILRDATPRMAPLEVEAHDAR